MSPGSQRRAETFAPWAAGMLLACPVLVAYYPPMTDLPYHEGAIGLLRHYGDAALGAPDLYERNLGEPNQLFHMAGWGLSLLMSTRWAVKLLVAAAVTAVPVCAGRFARHVGSSPLSAVVVAPLALGWLFSWGLVANLIGLACLLAVLPGLDRFARAPTARGVLGCVAAVVLLYFAHEAMLMAYIGAALLLVVVHPGWRERPALRLVPIVAGVVVVIAQALWQWRWSPALVQTPRLWTPVWQKVLLTVDVLLPPGAPWGVLALVVLSALAVEGCFWLRARDRRAGRPPPSGGAGAPPVRAWALAHRWELFAVACVAAYFAFPLTLNGATLVYQRWLPPGFAVLAVVAAPADLFTRATRVAGIARAAAFALPPAALVATAAGFADASRTYTALEEIIVRVAPGSSLATVDLGPPDPARAYGVGPAGGRILAVRGGRLAFAFTDSPVSPVVVRRQYQWTEPSRRLGVDSWALRPAQDLRRFRYLLAHVADPRIARALPDSLKREASLIVESGEWMLFESRLTVVPPASPEISLADSSPETLRERLGALAPAAAPGAK